MREGWEEKYLSDIASVEYGFTDKSLTEGNYRYVRITDINNNGELTLKDKKYLNHFKEVNNFILKDNDLLMARTGATFAKVLLYKDYEPSVFASYLIRIKFEKKILNKLYWYFSKSENYWDQANKLSSGSAQPHFNGSALKKVVFKYPKSLPEQLQIVSILDRAFTAIDQAKANISTNIENAKELFQSKLNAIFSQKGEGWEEKTLDENCKTSAGGTPLKSRIEYYKNGTIPWIRSGEVNNRNIRDSEIKITKEGLENSSAKLFPPQTVVIAMYGATAGQVGILNIESASNQAVCGIMPNSIYIPEFLYYFFLDFKGKLIAQAVGNAQPNISQAKIKNTLVPLVNLSEQKILVEKLDGLSQQISLLEKRYQEKLQDLDELKKSILQKAFAGELTSTGSVAHKKEVKV